MTKEIPLNYFFSSFVANIINFKLFLATGHPFFHRINFLQILPHNFRNLSFSQNCFQVKKKKNTTVEKLHTHIIQFFPC